MNSEDPDLHKILFSLWPYVWPTLGGLGGAFVSLGFAKNAELTARKKMFNLAAGTIMAVFVGPFIVRFAEYWFLGPTNGDSRTVGAIYCLVGLSATTISEKLVIRLGAAVDRLNIKLPGVGNAEEPK